MLRVCLGPARDLAYDLAEGDGAGEGQPGGQGLLLHVVAEDAGVGGEAGEGEAVVGVYGDDLFLVGGEVFCVALFVDLVSAFGLQRWLL